MQTKFKTYQWYSIPGLNTWRLLGISITLFLLTACSDFVEVDLPNNRQTSVTVFNDPATAEAALLNIYVKMRSAGVLNNNGLNTYMGLYADELDVYSNNTAYLAYAGHQVIASDPTALLWWGQAYNQIYAANDVIEGVEASEGLTQEERDQFKGEALFIRGYLHLLLTELYGDVPYITTTDYLENTTIARTPKAEVYGQLIVDLREAIGLLPENDISGENIRPHKAVAQAVLARAYLYTGQWAMAVEESTHVINVFSGLEPDLDKVFLKESIETIWQLRPTQGGAADGAVFIFSFDPSFGVGTALSLDLANAFEANDLRQAHWVGEITNFNGSQTWYYAHKYKQRNPSGTSPEYFVQLRLAEQYLIRAEARTHQNDIPGAQADIDVVRTRAGLPNTTANTLEELLEAILEERRVELFTEKGHRWFDLKRMGKAKEVLAPIKPNWKDTDVLLPIPEQELELNPDLLPQNDGYN